jgi:cystathionine gamma-synthase
MKSIESRRLETRAAQCGPPIDPRSGEVSPPISMSTTFGCDTNSELLGDYIYTRYGNPNQDHLQRAVSDLEGGSAALAFASGMAAASAVLQSLAPGDHLLMADNSYFGVRAAATDYASKWGIAVEFTDMSDHDNVAKRILPETQLLWAETPSNPMMQITDLQRVADLAHSAGARLLVDNTFATPVLQRPIESGADMVLHSATKYFGGHSDVLGGCLVFRRRDAFFDTVNRTLIMLGASLSPFNAWLVLRGLKTLACRMRVQTDNAGKLADMLSSHPNVSEVFYPGLKDHPGHETAVGQMSGFGAVVSFRVRNGKAAALATVGRAALFMRATSLGGVESLIEHRATSEGPNSTTPDDLVRLSVGIEHPDDLIEDLSQALCPV